MLELACTLLWTVAVLIASSLLALLYIYRPRTLPGIACWPNGHPLLGDLVRLYGITSENGSFTDFLDETANAFGPVSQIRLGPFAHMVIITDYLQVESLLLRRHSSLDRSSSTMSLFRTILPRALLTLKTGEEWRHHRRVIGPAMTAKYLSLTLPNVTRTAAALVELWTVKGRLSLGRPWEAEKDLESATMWTLGWVPQDAICGIAFGKSWRIIEGYIQQARHLHLDDLPAGRKRDVSFGLHAPDLAESTWQIFEAVPVQSPFPRLTHYFTQLTPSYRHHTRRVDEFLTERLREARDKARTLAPDVALGQASCTLDLMVARELEGEHGLSDFEMKQELFQYLLAGTETSSTTLAWWCKFMTNHPSVQRKLRQHLLAHLPYHDDRPATFDELSPTNVPYLEAVVHETLRLARTAGGYLRDTKEDMIILGHHVPKGTTLVFPTSTGYDDGATRTAGPQREVQSDRHPRRVGYWESGTGMLFDPDRWIEDGRFNPIAGPSLPFSLGQRRCFGKNLALLELRVFISQLSLAFFFAPIDDCQNGLERLDKVISHPRDCFVRPVRWDAEDTRV